MAEQMPKDKEIVKNSELLKATEETVSCGEPWLTMHWRYMTHKEGKEITVIISSITQLKKVVLLNLRGSVPHVSGLREEAARVT